MRGQTNSFDFMIGFMIFIIAILTFASTTSRIDNAARPVDAISISNNLVTTGYPVEWNETDVIRLGILTDGTLDTRKWSALRNMTLTNESRVRDLLGTSDGYRFSVADLPTITNDPTGPSGSEIRRARRVVAYNGSLNVLEVVTWR